MSVSVPLPDGVRVLRTLSGEDGAPLVLWLAVIGRSANCPGCRRRSRRVHSRYWRRIADLTCAGKPVRLHIRIRRFFCANRLCRRRTFAESVPSLAAVRAQRTDRLRAAQTRIGQAVGSRPGARLAEALHMPVSATTLLRQERSAPLPKAPIPRVLGVDDWAFKKGQRYGTLLLDLERHCIVDLLPDRSTESLAAWLKAHPGVQIISRDRSEVYADGARQGAPRAVQVADRFPLLKNAVEALERLVGRHHRQVQTAAADVSTRLRTIPTDLQTNGASAIRPTRVQREQAQRRAKRLARYEGVVVLHSQGASMLGIATQLGMSRHTVRRFLRAGAFPERAAPRPRPHQRDAWIGYLRQRWDEGCHNAAQLFREIKARGFGGCQAALRPYLRRWRSLPAAQRGPTGAAIAKRTRSQAAPSARTTAWLLLGYGSAREAERRAFESAFVERLCDEGPQVKAGQVSLQAFFAIVRKRQADKLDLWLDAATKSQIPELVSFACGLVKDKAAVEAALTCEVSNGQTEGQVNRLKFVKRRGFGRANFDLLRRRVLQPP